MTGQDRELSAGKLTVGRDRLLDLAELVAVPQRIKVGAVMLAKSAYV